MSISKTIEEGKDIEYYRKQALENLIKWCQAKLSKYGRSDNPNPASIAKWIHRCQKYSRQLDAIRLRESKASQRIDPVLALRQQNENLEQIEARVIEILGRE